MTSFLYIEHPDFWREILKITRLTGSSGNGLHHNLSSFIQIHIFTLQLLPELVLSDFRMDSVEFD